MTKKTKSLSQFQMAMQSFQHNRVAMVCYFILITFYFCAAFADIIAPYSFKDEQREYSYCPPTPVKFFNEKGLPTWPYVQGLKLSFNEYHKRIYQVSASEKYSIRFFVKGEKHKILGLIPNDIASFWSRCSGTDISFWGRCEGKRYFFPSFIRWAYFFIDWFNRRNDLFFDWAYCWWYCWILWRVNGRISHAYM